MPLRITFIQNKNFFLINVDCQEVIYNLFIVIAAIIILYITDNYICYLYHIL